MQARILPELDPLSPLGQQWEELVRSNPASGFMQSLYWAQVKRRQGLPVFHVGLFEDETLTGGAIFYTSTKRNGSGILIAPEGPVVQWRHEPLVRVAVGLLIDVAQEYARDLGIMAMRIEPRLVPPLMAPLREFGRAPADLVPKDTLYLDLSVDAHSLLAGMKEKGRYNIHLSERKQVSVSRIRSNDAVERFYNVMMEAGERDGFAVEPKSFFENLAQVLCPAGMANFFFTEHDGDTLGTLLLITYGSQATYLYGGITNHKRNLMGGYALQWAAINAAKEIGCKTYDFYGYDPFRVPEHRYARFSQFKSQFGGKVTRFIGAHDYFFLDNLADAFVKVVQEARPGLTTQPPRSVDAYVRPCPSREDLRTVCSGLIKDQPLSDEIQATARL